MRYWELRLLLIILLGGANKIALTSSDNLNNCLNPSADYFWTSSEPVNSPFGYGSMKVIHNGSVISQICVLQSKNNRKFVMRYFADSTWSTWEQIYDTSLLTNSTLLSPLASALGVMKNTDHRYNFTSMGQVIDIASVSGYAFMFVYFEGSHTNETLWYVTKADDLEVIKINGNGSELFDFIIDNDTVKIKSNIDSGGVHLYFYCVSANITLNLVS